MASPSFGSPTRTYHPLGAPTEAVPSIGSPTDAGPAFGSPTKKPFLPAFQRSSAERCKCEWAIVNFHGFFRDDGSTLDSNAFTASCSKFTSNSMWRLKIHPKYFEKGTEFVAFALERCLSDKESCPTVTAYVCLGICSKGGEVRFKQDYINHFRQGETRILTPVIERKTILDSLPELMPDDTLTVHCELDIYSDECRKFFDDIHLHSPPELKELSNDMKEFFDAARNTDINLMTDTVQVQCHKAVLSSRSHVLASSIGQLKDSVELRDIHRDVVQTFFTYIYSGNLSLLFEGNNHLLSKLFEAAKAFQLSDLESFLEPEVIHCRSIVPSYKYKFDWKIANFSKCKDCGDVEFDGPTTKWFAMGEAEWKVSLSIKNIRGSEVTPVFLNLKRKTSKQISHQVLFEFSLLNIRGTSIATKRAEFLFLEDDQYRLNIMSREQILNEDFILYRDTLTIFCNFVVSSPNVETTTETCLFNLVCDLEDEEDSDLRRLSSDFEELYHLDELKDMTINARDGKFQVHESIIDARCRCLITNESFKNRLSEMPSTVVESFLKFLYTGDRKYLGDHALQFYFLASDLNLEALKQRYFSRLAWILSTENVLYIIQEAYKVDDRALKSLAMTFIKEEDEMLNSKQFQDFKIANSTLAEEIITSVGSNVQ